MAKPERQQQVQDLLQGLRGIEPLKKLFWSELNYQRVNQPLSRRGWPEPATNALADDPVLFASGGDGGAFHVIYCRLTSKNLARGLERPVVTQLLREHPYALFIFSDKSQTDWHFLNVKFDDQAERRQLYRRITVRPGAGLRTATERVQLLDLAEIHPELFGITPLAIQQRCDAAFDVETVTKDFFTEVANWYFWALKNAKFPKDAPKEADGHDHISIIRLITRLIFCWFVKEKGLIPDTLFDQQKLAQILTGFEPAKASAKQSVFYKAILQNLFFATLNTEMDKRAWRKDGDHFMAHILYRHKTLFQKPGEALDFFKNIPFLNGGLFECLDKREETPEKPKDIRIDGFSDRSDSQPTVPDFLFFGPEREVDLSEEYDDKKFKSVPVRGLIHIFNRYNFTVEEDTPIDQEVALDPELSGKVFENLLAAYNPETGATARKQTGSFYTPREIVNYMVDESLIACLKTKLETALPAAKDVEKRLRQLFTYTDEPHQFTPSEVDALIAIIDSLKTLDPAVGSGAFPMGILHKLVFILAKLDEHNEKWRERQRQRAIADTEVTFKDGDKQERLRRLAEINEVFESNASDYGRKLYLIENCIYGVDIQPIAVQIAKMRFFISLIVDQKIDDKQPNRGVLPLPNLETKFVSANTLIGIERPDTQGKLFSNPKVDKLKSDLLGIRHRLFTAKSPSTKQTLREKDKVVRENLAGEIQKSLAKANEEEISQTRFELEKASKTLEAEHSKPVHWETQRITNLFGEVEETRIDTGKDKRRRLQEQVKQLESKLIRANQRDAELNATAGRLANWDPYDQNKFADFFDAEWMFGLVAGFDVVVANPPYIDSENMTNTNPELRALIQESYSMTKGNWDIYIAFYEKSFTLMDKDGFLSFITPDKWISKPFGDEMRRLTTDKIISILKAGRNVFESANVDAIVTVFANQPQTQLRIFDIKNKEIVPKRVIAKTSLKPPYAYDWLFSDSIDIFAKIEAQPNKLSNLGICENACATSDAYKLKEFVQEMPKSNGQGEYLRIINTGTIGKYASKWSRREMVYLGDRYLKPAVHKKRFLAAFQNSYGVKSVKPKLIVKGLNLLDACLDSDGTIIPGKTTLMITSDKLEALKFLLGIINSKVAFYYLKEKYPASSYNQGTTFTKDMINDLPVPRLTDQGSGKVVTIVDNILATIEKSPEADISVLQDKLNKHIYELYGLTEKEIKIVNDA